MKISGKLSDRREGAFTPPKRSTRNRVTCPQNLGSLSPAPAARKARAKRRGVHVAALVTAKARRASRSGSRASRPCPMPVRCKTARFLENSRFVQISWSFVRCSIGHFSALVRLLSDALSDESCANPKKFVGCPTLVRWLWRVERKVVRFGGASKAPIGHPRPDSHPPGNPPRLTAEGAFLP